MTNMNSPRFRAEQYHKALPEEIRSYLRSLGIAESVIDRQRIGWNGRRITIPVFDREGNVLTFRFAKSPSDKSRSAMILSEVGSCPELYGWDALAREPHTVVVCENEPDRLVLESRAYAAVASTGGPSVFLPQWAPYFAKVVRIYVCFARTKAGAAGARNVLAVLPWAKVVTLPAEAGEGGTMTDYFVRLGRTRVDFDMLLAAAAAKEDDEADPASPDAKRQPPLHKAIASRVERLKAAIPLADIVGLFTDLTPSGAELVGRCPFHEDTRLSFVIDQAAQTYLCSSCGARGDVIAFLMQKRSLTLGQALEALERFRDSDEL